MSAPQIQALAFKVGLSMLDTLPEAAQAKIRATVSEDVMKAVGKAGHFSMLPFAHVDAFVSAAYRALGRAGFLAYWMAVNRAVFALPVISASLTALRAVGLGRLDPLHIIQAAPMMWSGVARNAGKFTYLDAGRENAGTLVLSDAQASTIQSPGFAECWIAAFTVLVELSGKASDVQIAAEVDTLSRTMTLRCTWKATHKQRAA